MWSETSQIYAECQNIPTENIPNNLLGAETEKNANDVVTSGKFY